MDLAIARRRAHPLGQLVQQVLGAVVQDRMHRIEPQAVEVEFLDPVERVVNEELAHRRACSPSVLIAAPQGVLWRSVKVCGAIECR